MAEKCKRGQPDCGRLWDCGGCKRELYERIWRNLSPEARAYDRYVDPLGAYTAGITAPGGESFMDEECCSCHIDPPCNFCVDQSILEEEEE